jgi:hypothetical protein
MRIEEATTPLGPLERANLNHWIQLLVFFKTPDEGQSQKTPAIPNVIHHRQNFKID